MNYRNSLDESERLKLKNSRVCLVGCGGLGGYIAELLIRLGVGQIVTADGDKFDASNLNRQLNCTLDNIGKGKTEAIKQRAALISSSVEIIPVSDFLDENNAEKIIFGCDIVIDALDSFEARRTLHNACKKLGITMVFGAIGPWHIQYGVIPPESEMFDKVSISPDYHGDEMLSFVPSLCASYEVCEAVKLLTGNDSELMGKICDIDLITGEQIVIQI